MATDKTPTADEVAAAKRTLQTAEAAETARADAAYAVASNQPNVVNAAGLRNGMPAPEIRARVLAAAGYVPGG